MKVIEGYKALVQLSKDFWVKWTEWFDLDEPLTEPVDDGSVDDPNPLDVEFSEMVKSVFAAFFRVLKKIYRVIRE